MKKLIILLTLLLIPVIAWSAPPTRTQVYVSGAVIDPAKVTENEDNIYTYLQGGVDTYKDDSIVNADLSSTLALPDSKLAQITTASKVSASAITGDFTAVSISGGTITGITDLVVADGGTGASTFTDGGILLGSGTGAITALGVASNGEIPIGDGTTDPVLATITGTASEVDVTNAAGSITIGIVNPLAVAKGGTGSASGWTIASGCSVYLTADQDSNADDTRNVIGFNEEIFDIAGEWNATTNTWTTATTGKYLISFVILFHDTVDAKVYDFGAYINTTEYHNFYTSKGTGLQTVTYSRAFSLTAGDTVLFYISPTTTGGSGTDIDGAIGYSCASIIRI
jgi:hypothetical protein